MKQRLIFLSLLLTSCLWSIAQPIDYGNEWYITDPNRTFIKIQVDRNGVYRVTATELTNAGYDLSNAIPRNLHLYFRGEEQPIHVQTANGQLDYFDFYGIRNDGNDEKVMYKNPVSGLGANDALPYEGTSLYSDSAAYFLTWDNVPGRRFLRAENFGFSQLPAEQSFKTEVMRTYRPGQPSTNYSRGGGGAFDAFYTLNSDYIPGEGFVGNAFGYNAPFSFSINTPQAANLAGGSTKVQTRVFCKSNTEHRIRVEIDGNNNTPLLDTLISPNKVFIKTYTRFWNDPIGNETQLNFQALAPNTDNNNITWASLTYDRLPDLEGRSFMRIVEWNKSNNGLLRLTNMDGNDSVFVYDLSQNVRAPGLMNGTTGQVIVPGVPGERELYVASDKGLFSANIQASNSLSYLHNPDEGAEFVIITHRSLEESAMAYKSYRDTATVNQLSAKVVYVDQIYDEYGYGTISALAIKRFCKDAIDNWTLKPRYFLLWGKGKYQTRKSDGSFDDENLVPTYGYPASDYEFVSNYDPSFVNIKPLAAIGRVNAYDNAEGFAYLNKVKEYEATEWQSWMKQGVFLGGGGTVGEQTAIESFFNYCIDRFSDAPFGGEPFYFQKTSSSAVQDLNNASYHDEISEGVSLVHFFGHSTSNIQDIVLKEPFEYNNFGRYPFVIANGCYGGDFTGGKSFGERYITQQGRGAIGYLANSSAGYLNPLGRYSQVLYNVMYVDMLGEPIGDIVTRTIEVYYDSLGGKQYKNHAQQLNLQGDPSIRIYHPEKPDLEVNETSLFFTPDNFTALEDSFQVNIIVRNLGLVTQDSFVLSVRQRAPSGEWYSHPSEYLPMVKLRDTISIMLANPFGTQMTGQNIFEVYADSTELVEEYLEINNYTSLNKVVPGNIPAPLYPIEYAIVDTNRIHLDASAYFMTRDANVGYIFEIDTTNEFNSPLLVNSGRIEGKATFASWEVPFDLQDSTVYFWRVRLSDVTPSFWGNSSFKYIRTREGWAQAKFPQFLKDGTEQLVIDDIQQEWTFANFGTNYLFNVKSNGSFEYFLNGGIYGSLDDGLIGPRIDGVAFVVIDQYTLQPITTSFYEDAGFADVAPVPNGLYKLENAVQNMKEGDFIAISSNYNPKIDQWSPNTFEILEQIGVSDKIRLLNSNDRFLILGRKGAASAIEEYTPTVGDKFEIDQTLYAQYDEGKALSTTIGPSMGWRQLFWGWRTQDDLIKEFIDVDVYGVRYDETDSLLLTTDGSGLYDLNFIDAEEFRFMRLEAKVKDTVYRTPPQLDNWHVIYDPAPDAVVELVDQYQFDSDTLLEGQTAFLRMSAVNITAVDMDSLLIKFELQREDRTKEFLDTIRIAPLQAFSQEFFEYSFDTRDRNLSGVVRLIIELNPDNDQPEQYQFNNIFIQPFRMGTDEINPILDVTFDGKHIMDGDIVSPTPEIVVQVNDENPYIAIDDTSSIELYFRKARSIDPFERIFTSDARAEWQPASLPDNKAQITFFPGLNERLDDGEYTLRVQGFDEKGNPSGKDETYYEINFEVVNANTITDVLNYPNPFSTSTRFVYTLTGDQIPEMFQIHIYTITGKQIKVVDLLELGDVYIGRNVTEYAWDGTDEYGDRLANGVYLYRVVVKMPNASDLELRNEETSEYFDNGWGKMYLMR